MMKDKRTYKDRSEYLIKAVYARRKKVRAMAVEYKGGKCENCGYNRCLDALEFHHEEILLGKTLVSPVRDIPVAGVESKKS